MNAHMNMGMPMSPPGGGMGFVQPHINPRFAAQLGFNMNWMQQQQQQQFMPQQFQFGQGAPQQQPGWYGNPPPGQSHDPHNGQQQQ